MNKKVFHIKKKNSQLTNENLKKILKFKNKVWKFGLKTQMQWFLKNVKKNDVHVIGFLKENKKICSYTLLRKRCLIHGNKKKQYLYLDTFISDNKNINAFKLMKFNKKCIGKKICILICEKKFQKLYSFLGFKKFSKSSFSLMDHSLKKKVLMGFNIHKAQSKIKIYLNK